MVRPLGAKTDTGSVREPKPAAPLRLFGGNFQPLAPPDPFDPLVVDDPAGGRYAEAPQFSDSRSGHTDGRAQRCRRSAVLRHLAPPVPVAASNGAVRAHGRPVARTVSTQIERGQCRLGDARGLEVSLCSLREDHFVQGQIGDGTAQPGVLRLKFLHPFYLIRLQPAKLLAPPVICDFGNADPANGVRNRLPL